MARKKDIVSPLDVPGTNGGKLVRPENDLDLNVLNYEKTLFECVSAEHVRILGTTVGYWILNLTGAVDPLYNEAITRKYDGPYVMKAWVEFPPTEPEATEVGLSQDQAVTLWISKLLFEKSGASRAPKIGDIVQFWDTEYFRQQATLNEEPPADAGYFFDVIDSDEDGVLFDSPNFVGWTLRIRRNSKFTPERRIYEEGEGP